MARLTEVTVAGAPAQVDGTIKPTRFASSTARARLGELVGQLRANPTQDWSADYTLGPVLGEGGMAVVRLAEQRSLGRQVAVKTPRGESSAAHDEALLREAWVTGAVEHPNVVPVHALGFGPRGEPCLVLKRIEGVAWSVLIARPELLRQRFGATDALEWHLGVLQQVCRAVHFAHSRGIIHRDVKPENVMVGEFGEVYVLDWGIAVSLSEDRGGRFPLARDATELAGTPAYMAPEMVTPAAGGLGPHTDVYLLGATLFLLLAGRPPHGGARLEDALRSALTQQLEPPATAPAELARLLRSSTAREPAARLQSAEAFRLALAEFLRHRGAAALAEEAGKQLHALFEALGVEPDDVDEPGIASGSSAPRRAAAASRPAAAREQLYHLFGECRFGLRHSLRSWPENEEAQCDLQRAIVAMVEYEMAYGSLDGAAALLPELPRPRPALAARLAGARMRDEAARRQAQAHEKVGRELDPRVGRKARVVLGLVAGAAWTVGPFFSRWFETGANIGRSNITTGLWAALSLVLIGVVLARFRRALLASSYNRRAVGAMIVILLGHFLLAGGGALMALPIDASRTLQLFLWCLGTAVTAVTMEHRLFPAALGYAAAYLVATAWQDTIPWAMSLSNLVLTVNVAYAWRRRPAAGDGEPRE